MSWLIKGPNEPVRAVKLDKERDGGAEGRHLGAGKIQLNGNIDLIRRS